MASKLYFEGIIFFASGNWEKADEFFIQCAAMVEAKHFAILAMKRKIFMANAKNEYELVKSLAHDILKLDPNDTFAFVQLHYGPSINMPHAKIKQDAVDIDALNYQLVTHTNELNYIVQVEPLRMFYMKITAILNSVLTSCMVLQSNLVKKQESKSQKYTSAAEAVANATIELTGISGMVVFGIGPKAVVSLTMKGVDALIEYKERQAIRKKHQIAKDLETIIQVSDMVATQLSLMFERQIHLVHPKTVEHLAEHFIYRMFDGYMNSDEEFVFAGKTLYEQQKAAADMLVKYAVYTPSPKKATIASNINAVPKFNLNDLISKCGIITPSGEYYCLPLQDAHLTLGFRLGTEEECKAKDMDKCEPDGVLRFLQPTPNFQSFKQEKLVPMIRLYFEDKMNESKAINLLQRTMPSLRNAIQVACNNQLVKSILLNGPQNRNIAITKDEHVATLSHDDVLSVAFE